MSNNNLLINEEVIAVIYDKFDINFARPISLLRNIKDAEVYEELNGEFRLDISVPLQDGSELLKADNYIKVAGNTFKILEVSKSRSNGLATMDAECEHVYFEVLDDYIPKPDRRTFFPHELALYLQDYTDFNINVSEEIRNNPDKFPKKRVTISRGSPIKTLLRMVDLWDLDLHRVNRDINVISNMNMDKIQLFKHQKNLISLKRVDYGGQLTTRLYPIGKDGLTFDGILVDEIPYATETEGNMTTIISEDDVVLGRVLTKDGVVVNKYIDSKYLDSYPRPRNGEEIISDIEDKMDLLLHSVVSLNNKDSINTSYELEVEELKSIYGPIEKFGLGYKVLLQDEELLRDEEFNLVESRITEYTYNPFNNGESSKVKMGSKRKAAIDFFNKIEDKLEEDELPSDGGGDDGGHPGQPEETKATTVHWTANKNTIEITNQEVEIANIVVETDNGADGQGELLVNFISDTDSVVILKLYDNDTQELYSPIVMNVNAGYNSIGVPNGIYNRSEGAHELTVTLQSNSSTIHIQPRGVSYNAIFAGDKLEKLEANIDDVSIRMLNDDNKTSNVYTIGSNGVHPVVMRAPYTPNRRYSGSDFDTLWNFTSLTDECKNLMLEFNGYFSPPKGSDKFVLITQDKPWIFWINKLDELWSQYGNEPNTAIMLAEGVLQASAVKGWNMKNQSVGDMGLVVAYIKYDGKVAYRQLKGLRNEIEDDADWSTEVIITEAGLDNKAVYVNRLNDYRIAFAVDGVNKLFITERSYVGQASPKEFINVNPGLDPWMSMLTAIPTSELPYDIKPISDDNDFTTFKLIANYDWDMRGQASKSLDIISNTSLGQISRVYVDEYDSKVLNIEMDRLIKSGSLVVRPDKRHLIGKHENGTRIEVNLDIEVFYVILTGEYDEIVEINPSLISQINTNRIMESFNSFDEYIGVNASMSSFINIAKIAKLYNSNIEHLEANIDLDSLIEIVNISDIIT